MSGFQCDAVDLDKELSSERSLNSRPRRLILREEGFVNFVHRAEILNVRKVNSDPDDIVERCASSFYNRFYIFKRLSRLSLDAVRQLSGLRISSGLSGYEKKLFRQNSLGVWASWLWRIV